MRGSLNRDLSEVNSPKPVSRFLKYWLSNVRGVTGSWKNWVLGSKWGALRAPLSVQLARSSRP